ncbi:nicotinate-nucleotide adenylyltransferase [Halovulum dunhuangense]|uniref:Probable nicotinate-nucleotide adenylyltransferase n=1 Tax=Halovulum dunhuangense TaxID=1505036 RepID=A0A849L225_9RHOB|nr:nicotinate-nucleotide adenylyltransferase [Halovulum dunhuangense]
MRQGYPRAGAGMRIGLLGGSFDPPHAGHVHISRQALARLGLDRVWWLVSPGNPLKPDAPAALARRMAACRALVAHPRIEVTDIEARLGTRYTADTIAAVQARYPGVRFVWLMGADNMAGFHAWVRWREIMARVPVAVTPRPGWQIAAGLSPSARIHARDRLAAEEAGRLAGMAPPVWVMLPGAMVALSSTALRAQGRWRR